MTFDPGRRDAFLLAAALAAPALRPAHAQRAGQPPANVVLPVPPPCASRPDDIVGLVLEGPSDPAVVVFGQAFRRGDLPPGASLGCRRADGQPLPVQFDRKIRHPDGSARHGAVSLAVPGLGRGERLNVVLTRSRSAAAGALDLREALAGRDATLEVTPLTRGAPWRVDLLAAWASQRAASPWQSGPLAVQGRVSLPAPPAAVGGATSMRLVADIAVHADGALWVDAWLRNDIAMRPGGGEASYAMRLLIDGREVLAAELPRHFQYQGFGRLRGARRGGAPAPALPFLRHDVTYLADTAAIPRYDQSTGGSERWLAELAEHRNSPDWGTPLGTRRIATAMGSGGGRPDIGPMTGYQAIWLCSGDRRAAAFAMDQAEAAGSIPWHHWDIGDGRRPATWINTVSWPGFWTDQRGGRPPRTLLQPVSDASGWRLARSHQPDLSYVPYLLTGRRAFLDGLLAQGCWSIVGLWPAVRRGGLAALPLDDVIVLNGAQNRSHAWGMRQVQNAAWIAPEGDVAGDYLRRAEASNWLWMRSRLAAWTELQGEAHGWVPGVYGADQALPPWQQDYLASTVALGARRGNEDAVRCLAWMSNFLVGRFFAEASGFPRHDAVAYRLDLGLRSDGPPRQSWAAIAAATRARGWSNGSGWAHSEGDYPRWALQSLAQITETLRDPRAREAYLWLLGAGAPFTTPEIYAGNAQLNIVPRDIPRVPARALRCAA